MHEHGHGEGAVNRKEQIVAELRALQRDGVKLPGTPEQIADIELNGGMVDLSSGQVDNLQWLNPTRVNTTGKGRAVVQRGWEGV